jgi:hypothetical protein
MDLRTLVHDDNDLIVFLGIVTLPEYMPLSEESVRAGTMH